MDEENIDRIREINQFQAAAGQRTYEAHAACDRPALVLWADSDPVLSLDLGRRLASQTGWPEPEVIGEAGHFLQEDQGRMIGERIAAWLDDAQVPTARN